MSPLQTPPDPNITSVIGISSSQCGGATERKSKMEGVSPPRLQSGYGGVDSPSSVEDASDEEVLMPVLPLPSVPNTTSPEHADGDTPAASTSAAAEPPAAADSEVQREPEVGLTWCWMSEGGGGRNRIQVLSLAHWMPIFLLPYCGELCSGEER